MLNVFPKNIEAVSSIETSVVSVRYKYAGLIQVSGYHSGELMLKSIKIANYWDFYFSFISLFGRRTIGSFNLEI